MKKGRECDSIAVIKSALLLIKEVGLPAIPGMDVPVSHTTKKHVNRRGRGGAEVRGGTRSFSAYLRSSASPAANECLVIVSLGLPRNLGMT